MSHSDPNVLNRWLDRNPLTALTRCGFFLTLPAFDIGVNWRGYSDIVGAYTYVAPNNFVIKDFISWIPTDPTYTLCVAFKNKNGTVTRYRLWTAVGEVFYSTVPVYDGQVIKKKFRFEIWSGSAGNAIQTTDLTPVLVSVLQNIDYRNGIDALWIQPSAFITDFDSDSAPLNPSLTGLILWLDATQGITLTGGRISAWADRTGNIIMQQGTAGLRPTSGGSYVQFLGDAVMTSNVIYSANYVTKYYVVAYPGFIGGVCNNNIINQNGSLGSGVHLNVSAIGGKDATFNSEVVHVGNTTGLSVVEMDTVSGEVWLYDSAIGSGVLQGTAATRFWDYLNLIIGGPGNLGTPLQDENGVYLRDENGNVLYAEGSGTTVVGAGFNVTNILAYTSQTEEERLATLHYLMPGSIPLPFVFPPGSYLISNTN